MKLVGLLLVRNEDWILPLSLDVACRWCDEVVVVNHASTDLTGEIAAACRKARVRLAPGGPFWDEQTVRQEMLVFGRELGGTHFALIDADEILTANLLPWIRGRVEALKPGECLDLPMVPAWRSIGKRRVDECVWTRAQVTVAVCDRPDITWAPAGDGYHHHSRRPHGSRTLPVERVEGGVIHAQWVNWPRLLAKHVLYRMVDHLRWPDRRGPVELNRMYDQALDERGLMVDDIPEPWLAGYDVSQVKTDGVPWQAQEIALLLARHGREAFRGLDLKGF